MTIKVQNITLQSTGLRPTFHTITDQVKDFVEQTGVQNGLCVVYTHHTTCSVMTQECSFDIAYTGLEYLQQDLVDVFEGLVPTCHKEGQYMHPGPLLTEYAAEHGESKPETLNTDAHLRSVFLGRNETIPIVDGVLDLGSFGHVYFIDFDTTRPRQRIVTVQVMGE